jgi:hypothetical protein
VIREAVVEVGISRSRTSPSRLPIMLEAPVAEQRAIERLRHGHAQHRLVASTPPGCRGPRRRTERGAPRDQHVRPIAPRGRPAPRSTGLASHEREAGVEPRGASAQP